MLLGECAVGGGLAIARAPWLLPQPAGGRTSLALTAGRLLHGPALSAPPAAKELARQPQSSPLPKAFTWVLCKLLRLLVLAYAAKELARRVKTCSVLGDYAAPLSGVRLLVGVELVALALATAPEFLPNLRDITGRGIEVRRGALGCVRQELGLRPERRVTGWEGRLGGRVEV